MSELIDLDPDNKENQKLYINCINEKDLENVDIHPDTDFELKQRINFKKYYCMMKSKK